MATFTFRREMALALIHLTVALRVKTFRICSVRYYESTLIIPRVIDLNATGQLGQYRARIIRYSISTLEPFPFWIR